MNNVTLTKNQKSVLSMNINQQVLGKTELSALLFKIKKYHNELNKLKEDKYIEIKKLNERIDRWIDERIINTRMKSY
jgi:hypothetical protein